MKFEVSRGKNIMERKYKIGYILINIKNKVKNCVKVIFRIAFKDKYLDSFDMYNADNLNFNNYERCKIEIETQKLRSRTLF